MPDRERPAGLTVPTTGGAGLGFPPTMQWNESLSRNFPPELRDAYRDAVRAREWSSRHKGLLDFAEATLGYLASLCLSDYRTRCAELADNVESLIERSRKKPLTMGRVLGLFEASAMAMPDPLVPRRRAVGDRPARLSEQAGAGDRVHGGEARTRLSGGDYLALERHRRRQGNGLEHRRRPGGYPRRHRRGGTRLDESEEGALAARVESSDGSMYPGIAAVNHKTCMMVKAWDWYPEFAIVMLVPRESVDTPSIPFTGQEGSGAAPGRAAVGNMVWR